MIKSIFKQLWNQRKTNAWITIELLLVAVFLWFIVDHMAYQYNAFNRPMGFDIEDTYRIYFDELSPSAPQYISTEQAGSSRTEDLQNILSRIRKIEGIEALSASTCAMPYSLCNSGNLFTAVHNGDSISRFAMTRMVLPEYFKVFRIRTPEGKIAGQEHSHKVVVSADFADSLKISRGDSLINGFAGTWFITDVCTPVRYAESRQDVQNGYTVIPETELINERWPEEICIRFRNGINEEQRKVAWERIKELSQVNNFSFFYYESFKDIRKDYLQYTTDEIKTQCSYAFFLLTNVFLGIIGTFWFRTRYRRAEIGLRLAIGATRKSIFTYLIKEGMILLSCMMIIATVIMVNILYAGLLAPDASIPHFLLCMIITWLLMAAMIIVGIWYPARQAMKIQPAEALHEE